MKCNEWIYEWWQQNDKCNMINALGLMHYDEFNIINEMKWMLCDEYNVMNVMNIIW